MPPDATQQRRGIRDGPPLYSRYAVGWTVQHRETATLAEQLIAQTIEKQQITPGTLTIHADRGSSMTSKPVAFLPAELVVTKTHSRSYTSTDNPYSEAHFKTLKYRPVGAAHRRPDQQAHDRGAAHQIPHQAVSPGLTGFGRPL